jgi:DNA-binding transcriptional regulator GbsR (MarR family)
MTKANKVPTVTSQVMEALTQYDDFLSMDDIVALTGCSKNNVSSALFALRHYKAVDVVIQPDGRGWWFAVPELDLRTKVLEMRTPEEKPRRRKKVTVKKVEPKSEQ